MAQQEILACLGLVDHFQQSHHRSSRRLEETAVCQQPANRSPLFQCYKHCRIRSFVLRIAAPEADTAAAAAKLFVVGLVPSFDSFEPCCCLAVEYKKDSVCYS